MNIETIRSSFANAIGERLTARSERLVQAFAKVPRERFVGPGPWTIACSPTPSLPASSVTPDADPSHIYADVSVAIDPAHDLYNGSPFTVAEWLAAADIGTKDRVYHVGCGSGYYSAILAEMVPEGRVVAIEIQKSLAERARSNLRQYPNVEVVEGNGVLCEGFFDVIIVHAGATHPTSAWLDALANGGKLLVPLTFELPGTHLGKGGMLKIARDLDRYSACFLKSPLVIFSLIEERDIRINEKLLHSFRTSGLAAVKSLRRDPHPQGACCWLHASNFCLSSALPGETG